MLPDREAPIACGAEVVWNKATETVHKSYEIPASETGVRFVRIDPKEQAQLMQYARLNTFPGAP